MSSAVYTKAFSIAMADEPPAVQGLSSEHEAEVLSFLAVRPVHTVFLSGFIRDNGLESLLNRGTFYAYRDLLGRIEGVALIGHATLFEARSEAALAAFAQIARSYPHLNLILGEQVKVQRFWRYYSQEKISPRRSSRELLFEQRWPVTVRETVPELRLATEEDLSLILPINSELIFKESGVNPLEIDPEGFRTRCLRRVEQGRVWVWTRNDRLIFSAEVMAKTPDCTYLEGVYVSPEERGKGYGLRCLSQLSRKFLQHSRSVCLFVNERNKGAQIFYKKAGYKLRSYYSTIYLHRNNDQFKSGHSNS